MKNKKYNAIPILSISLLLSIGSLVYSSITLYNSSNSFIIRQNANNIKNFITLHNEEWNNLCLLISNNSNKVTKYMNMTLVNGNSSFIYISYFYSEYSFKYKWNEYINGYKPYNIKDYLKNLENDLNYNSLIINSSSRGFCQQLSSVIENVKFNKLYDLWVFWLNLLVEIITIILVIILSIMLYKKIKKQNKK